MKKLLYLAAICFSAFILVTPFSSSAKTPKAQKPKGTLKTDMDSLSYAYGIQITQGLEEYLQQMGIRSAAAKEAFFKNFLEASKVNEKDTTAIALSKARLMGQQIGMQVSTDMFSKTNETLFGSNSTQSLNKSQFLAGFLAAAQNKPLLMGKETAQTLVQEKTEALQAKANEKLKTENQAFLDENKKKAGVIVTPSGLQYKVEKEGTGIKPAAEDTVMVNYVLTDISGKKLDGNNAIKFALNQVIPGWTEGIQLMSQGAKYTLYVPYNLAYGEQGRRPQIEPYATLIFDIDLLEVMQKH